ncbi:7574_t:CDS:2, partial [Dentiscutata heterogama]
AQEIKLGMEHRYPIDNNYNMENSNRQLENLRSFDNWKIIKYDDILSLYELLPDELKEKIKQTIGMRMLHSAILLVTVPKNHDFRFPLVTEVLTKPDEISTFKDCKIFASVYNETSKDPFLNTYGIYVYYQHNEDPCFVVYRTGSHKISSKTKLYIPWMIFGYDKFPTKPFSKLDMEYIEYIGTTEDAETDIKLKMPIIQACYILNPVNSPLKVKFNYVAISKNNKNYIGQTNNEWKSRQRHFSYLKGRSIFTGEKWNLPKDKRFAFASIFYTDSVPIEKRYFLLLNINPKYPITKSLTEITENP